MRKDLTEEEIDLAINLVLEGQKFTDIAKKLGFKNRQEFHNYCRSHPEFKERLDQARNDYCDHLEDLLLDVPIRYHGETAKVLSQNIMKILEYRNPKRYSPKFQHEITTTIDIASSLDKAERRVLDITQSNVIAIDSLKKTPTDENAG